MRVAWVHTDALSSMVTGEDLAAAGQCAALRRAGIDVREVPAAVPRRGVETAAVKVLLSGRNPGYVEAINAAGADVVHLHKWYPWLGRNDLPRLCRPLVATVHNFRPVCPVGTLFREGRVCTDCVSHAPLPAIRHGCFDQSRIRTLPVALSRPFPARRHPLFEAVDVFVAPSRRAAEMFCEPVGIGADRIRILPSFVEPLGVSPSGSPCGWLFVGQLEETKGVKELVSSWPGTEELTVVGSGSLGPELAKLAGGRRIRLLGRRSPREVRELMAGSQGLLFPGSYVETQGLVVGEAASVGCPVIARKGTAGADQVEEHGFGVTVADLTGLSDALAEVTRDRPRLSAAALGYWRRELTPGAWVAGIRAVYSSVLRG